jgi:hypothetical protein
VVSGFYVVTSVVSEQEDVPQSGNVGELLQVTLQEVIKYPYDCFIHKRSPRPSQYLPLLY